jgi:glycosyltransferase involved in cell wall biosynthesis
VTHQQHEFQHGDYVRNESSKSSASKSLNINDLDISIVIPAKNEESSLSTLLPRLAEIAPNAEVIVVNDGSTDETADTALRCGAKVVSHPYSMGNGAAIKTGARAASGTLLILMDADSQHDPADIPRLLATLDQDFDMAVGSRTTNSHANIARRLANGIYNWLASYMTGQTIRDLTSGFRATRTAKFREFLYLLPNGFSYPTTTTMAFFRAGYSVSFVPIVASRRAGSSHIRPLQDGLRFLLIIFKIGTLYSPLKIFVPASAAFFGVGISYYLFTYITEGRFTNMSALMLTTAVIVFLIGLVSEQITQLMYKPSAPPQETQPRHAAKSAQRKL